ncbi:MAG: hypothetical protein J7578_06290 [Chitinophagaceae bacterium]|nr:hypothetical protein [Chitinophagaceae bacterium]
MAPNDYHRNSNQKDDSDCNCKEIDNPTQLTINRERLKICSSLYEASGKVSMLEKKFKGEKRLYNDKTCLFNHTEENYRLFRNLEITVGTELLQTNDSVKANVKSYNDWNTALNKVLKEGITKAVKDVKAKFADLNNASFQLDSCRNEKCNQTQVAALTGEKPEGCKEEPKEPPKECSDASDILDELICMPSGLATDIDSIFQSSSDVVGIQVFSNIDTLDALQKKLEDQSKQFEAHVNAVMKLRADDLKNLQLDLVKSVQSITKSAMDRNSSRSEFEGYKDAIDYICCPKCKCLEECDCHDNDNKEKKDNRRDCDELSEPRLQDCEEEICKICDKVKQTFCCDEGPGEDPDKGDCGCS